MGKDATVAAAATQNNAVNVNLAHANEIVELKGIHPILTGDSVLLRVTDKVIPVAEENQLTGAIGFGVTNSTRERFSRIFAVLSNKYAGFNRWWEDKKNDCISDRLIDGKASKGVKDTIVIGLALEMGAQKAKMELLDKIVVDVKFIPLEAYEKYVSADGYEFADRETKRVVSEVDVRVHPELKSAFAKYAVATEDVVYE